MPKPPKKPVAQQFLDQAFDEGQWGEKLKTFRAIEFYNRPTPPEGGQALGTCTVGVKYYDHQQNLVAVVVYYRKPNGTLGASGKPSPKGLLLDGVWHYK